MWWTPTHPLIKLKCFVFQSCIFTKKCDVFFQNYIPQRQCWFAAFMGSHGLSLVWGRTRRSAKVTSQFSGIFSLLGIYLVFCISKRSLYLAFYTPYYQEHHAGLHRDWHHLHHMLPHPRQGDGEGYRRHRGRG